MEMKGEGKIAVNGKKQYKDGFIILFFKYFIQHCFISRLSGSTVSEDAEIEPRTGATFGIDS
jgi:hypothetical protein